MNISDKQAVTLNIDPELLRSAQARKIDLSKALETYLCQTLDHKNGPDFCESYAAELSNNKKDIATLKEYGETHGIFET